MTVPELALALVPVTVTELALVHMHQKAMSQTLPTLGQQTIHLSS